MGLASRLACARARDCGHCRPAPAGEVGPDAQQLEDPRTRIPVRNQIEFLNRVADALGDDMLGFQLALDFDLRQAGLLYYVLASSDTLREVFERGARFAAMVNEGVIQELHRRTARWDCPCSTRACGARRIGTRSSSG